MDFNVVVLSGKLAAPPEIREFNTHSNLVRLLVTVRSDMPRRRVDVVPVTLWEPDPAHPALDANVGAAVWVAGTVQRRFWAENEARASRLEVVATEVQIDTSGDKSGWSEIAGPIVDRARRQSSRVPRCEESQ